MHGHRVQSAGAQNGEPKIHVNTVQSLLGQLRKRLGVVFLKRLSIILDEDSEKGFGLVSYVYQTHFFIIIIDSCASFCSQTNANAALFSNYDIIGLVPLTQPTFSLACLTHGMPSP